MSDFSIAPIYDEKGDVALLMPEAGDITALKSTESALREKEQEIRTLVEHTPDGMIRYDRNLRRIYVNPAVARFSSVTPGEPADNPLYATDAALYERSLREAFRTGRGSEIEI